MRLTERSDAFRLWQIQLMGADRVRFFVRRPECSHDSRWILEGVWLNRPDAKRSFFAGISKWLRGLALIFCIEVPAAVSTLRQK